MQVGLEVTEHKTTLDDDTNFNIIRGEMKNEFTEIDLVEPIFLCAQNWIHVE